MKILITIGIVLVLVGIYGLSYNKKVPVCEMTISGKTIHLSPPKKLLSNARQNACAIDSEKLNALVETLGVNGVTISASKNVIVNYAGPTISGPAHGSKIEGNTFDFSSKAPLKAPLN